MKEAILNRVFHDEIRTLGLIIFDIEHYWATIELPWKDNKPDISSIPNGTYLVKKRFSEKHKGIVFGVESVPGRTDCEIHVANFVRDILGCIGIGMYWQKIDGEWAVSASGIAFREFMDYMKDDDTFRLTIKSV